VAYGRRQRRVCYHIQRARAGGQTGAVMKDIPFEREEGWPSLRPCPFCGETDLLLELHDASYITCCNLCLAAGPPAPSAGAAVRRWNASQTMPQEVR